MKDDKKNQAPGGPPPDWARIMGALEKWRKDLDQEGAEKPRSSREPRSQEPPASGEPAAPSVTTVAERFRRDPWAVLVSTILSLRTKDEVTLAASERLLARAGSPGALLLLGEEECARLAYPVGFYRTKAANLMKIAAILIERHGGEVPADMEALLALPGAGRKTANLVLIEAFDMEGICVDVHVHRISNRTGWVSTKTPEETEAELRRILPRRYWKGINALLVLYGQRLCRPQSPFCSRCVISPRESPAFPCPRRGVDKSR